MTLFSSMQAQEKGQDSKKSIVVYYSRRGNNYVNGNITDLKVGNTEVIANKIQKLTSSDIFRIETKIPYPAGYQETTEKAKKELESNARPQMEQKVDNIDQYDVIYLGYPNWWGTMPMVMFGFLESFDTAGKTIMPFCTHEGSRLGKSEADIKKLCPEAKVLPGLAIRGSNVNSADKEIERWINLSN